jgi:hypothetical protein
METAAGGIVGRGVLLDLAAVKGKAWLEPEDRLTPTEFEQAIAATGTTLKPGDILYLHSGVDAMQKAEALSPGSWVSTGGLQVECAEMIHRAGVAVIVSDGGTDSRPSEVESVAIPWHVLCIVQMGVRLVDCAYLADLLSACRSAKRSEFFTVISPASYVGATSSPVNPICML